MKTDPLTLYVYKGPKLVDTIYFTIEDIVNSRGFKCKEIVSYDSGKLNVAFYNWNINAE